MKADTYATKLINEYETNNPFKICEDLGILIQRSHLLDLRGYYMCADGVSIITLGEGMSSLTERFVCAHELGHYIMHRKLNRIFLDAWTNFVVDKYENSADRFAYYFSFPCDERYSEFQQITVWDMADCLNVAATNVESRLEELRIYH